MATGPSRGQQEAGLGCLKTKIALNDLLFAERWALASNPVVTRKIVRLRVLSARAFRKLERKGGGKC